MWKRSTLTHNTLELFSAALVFSLAAFAKGQTLVSHDSAGNRSAETSNQPITPPVITDQPLMLLGQVGGTYSFSVTASGANLTYQWYKDSTAISGATGDTLTITNAQTTDFSNHSTMTGMYSVIVSNTAGSTTSNSVALWLDSYGVGIPDWWQQEYFPSTFATGLASDPVDPLAAPNGNGITNLQAYQDGLNPTSITTEGYSLTTSGPVTVSPSQASYAPSSTVTLSVPSGMLQNWSGNAAGSANPLNVTMSQSKTIQAITTDFANAHYGATLSTAHGASVNSLLVQANGQIMVGGSFDAFLGRPQCNLGRINANGSLDTGLFPGSVSGVGNVSGSSTINDMAQQPDGKVIVVGSFYHSPVIAGANPPNYIARFNTDGTLDQTFMVDGLYPDGTVNAVAVQSDGHIVIAGSFGHVGSAIASGIARLNGDGSLDTTFGAGTGGSSWNSIAGVVAPGCIQVDSSNNIYVGGNFSSYDGTTVSDLIRLTSTGTLDTTFSTGSGFGGGVTCFTQIPGGGLYVGGYFTGYNGSQTENIVALTNTGSINTSFNAGSATSNAPNQVLILPSGQLVLALSYGYWQGQTVGGVIKLSSSGSLITGFNPTFGGTVNKMALLSNGDILMGGNFSSVGSQTSPPLAEFTSGGALDTTAPTYHIGSALQNTLGVAAQQSDGKLLVFGDFNEADNSTFTGNGVGYSLIRLNTDGSVDSTFNAGTGPNNASVSGIIPLATGGAILYGAFSSYSGTSTGNCIEINSNGSLNTSFSSTVAGGIASACLQSTGKIVIATGYSVERLTTTGAVDSSFTISLGNGEVNSVAADAQDRILIGGNFTSIGSNSASFLARLNSNGSFDSTFAPPAPNTTINQIAVSTLGQIVVRGSFSQVGTTNQAGLARFTSTGTLDPIPGENALGGSQAMGVQSDGSIVLARNSTLYRLLPNGVTDSIFNPNLNSTVQNVAIGNNDDIYALGSFTTDASEFASGIARYSASPHLILQLAGTIPTGSVTVGTPITIYGTASTTQGSIAGVSFLYSSDGINYQLASAGSPFSPGEWTGVWAPPAAGTYYLRLSASDTTGETGNSTVTSFTATSGSPQIATPTLSLGAGSYSSLQYVTVSDTTPGVQIYYTLDGSNPATSATRILLGTGGIIPVSQSASLSVQAFYASGTSTLTSASYSISSSLLALPTGAPSSYPNWWFSRGVISQTGTYTSSPAWPSNYPAADDFAAMNQGQLKNLATKAYDELASVLPATAWVTPQGQTLTTLIEGLNPSGGDAYAVASLGQLKTVAQPFYDLLKQQSMASGYPWTGVGADDYSVANVGQAKNVFNSTIP